MKTQTLQPSPRLYARAAGSLYLIVIVAGIVAQMFISGRIVVPGDAAQTAANILADRTLFELGLTVYMIEMASQVAMFVLLYVLLRPVSRSLSLLALSFGILGCVIKTLSRLFYAAPLLVLGDHPYLGVFDSRQLQALALLLLDVNDRGAAMALAFFGVSTFLNGYLIFKSDFLPRFLGLLSMFGGLGWLTFLYAPLGYRLFPFILLVGLIGGLSQILWLLIKGVDVPRWQRRAAQPA